MVFTFYIFFVYEINDDRLGDAKSSVVLKVKDALVSLSF